MKIDSIDNSLELALYQSCEKRYCPKHNKKKIQYVGGYYCPKCDDEDYYEAKKQERSNKIKKKGGDICK